MTIIVHKYGGSSVATPERLQVIAKRVVQEKQRGLQPVVVVSAMGRTTDALLGLAREISDKPHRRELDMILTAGERISMALLAMAIGDLGCKAVSLTGSQAGIITTTDHNHARIIEVRPLRVHEALERGQIVIVGGFAGVSTDKEVTTLGRGGSDTTAIALAAALEARECDIFSDVDGIYSADPRVVDEARRIDQLACGEALEMGLRGARVLAPEAVDYARRHGVTLHARSSFTAGSGTVITNAPRPGTGRAVAVAANESVVPVRIEGPAAAVSAVLDALDLSALSCSDFCQQNDDELSSCELRLDTQNTADWQSRLDELKTLATAHGGALHAFPEHGTVSVVGEGIAEQGPCWRIARQQLQQLSITPRRLSSTAWSITAEIPRSRISDVVRAWHGAFPGLTNSPALSRPKE